MKISAQEYADRSVAEQYRQPLLTLDEALTKIGWPKSDWEPQGKDRPDCCGKPVTVRAFIGSPYFANCETCRKFIADATGPVFHNSYVEFADPEKVDLGEDGRTWISGVELS